MATDRMVKMFSNNYFAFKVFTKEKLTCSKKFLMFYNKLKQLSILLICLSFSVSGLSNDVLAQGQPTLKSDLIEILRKSGIKYDEGAIEDNSKNVSFTGKRIELPITFEETKSTTDIYKATFDLSVDDDQNRIFTGIFKKIETNFDGESTSSDRIVLEVLYNQNSGTNSISKATVTIEDIKIDITEQIIIKIKKAESKVTQEVPGQGRHGLSLTNIDVKLIDEGISLTNGDIKISVEKNNFDKSVSPESIPVEIGAYIREILHPENLLTLYYPKPGDMGEIILGVEGSSSEIKLNNMSYNNWRISFQEPKLNVKTFAFNLNTSDIIKNEIQGAFSVSLSDIRGLEGTDYPNEITPKDININIEYFNFPS